MEGKKSFVLYANYIDLLDGYYEDDQYIEGMTDEEAGKWIKTIFRYVNDLNPEIPREIKQAFILVRKDLKADLVKYNAKVESIKKAREIKLNTNNTNRNQVDINMKSSSNQVENNSVNVNDNVNVNVNVNDNEISKDIINNIVSFNKETTPEATKDTPPVVIALPCLKGYNHPIYEDDINHYQNLYPAVNVHQELKLMLGWLESNPNNRKTKNGIKAFITRWLSKKQDKAPTNTEGYKPPKPKRSDFDSVDEFYKAYDEWAIKYNGGFNEFEFDDNKIGNSDGWRKL